MAGKYKKLADKLNDTNEVFTEFWPMYTLYADEFKETARKHLAEDDNYDPKLEKLFISFIENRFIPLCLAYKQVCEELEEFRKKRTFYEIANLANYVRDDIGSDIVTTLKKDGEYVCKIADRIAKHYYLKEHFGKIPDLKP